MTRTFFTPPQLHQMSGIKLDNIIELIHRGELKAYNTALDPNGQRPRWRISKDDWEAFLAARANAPAPPAKPVKRRRKTSPMKEWF